MEEGLRTLVQLKKHHFMIIGNAYGALIDTLNVDINQSLVMTHGQEYITGMTYHTSHTA